MNKTLDVILKLTDQFTSPLQQSSKGVKGFGKELAALATGVVSLGGIALVLRNSFQAADDFRISLQKLEGTAKITGVPLGYLRDIAAKAETQFGLSKVQASDFAVEMAKLATKAGDVGKAGPALQAFLDIGAARGLTAGETLKAVQQAILGIDEGTDKLFNANPSVLYAAFAAEIGITAGKLTDQQKAQALLNAAMTDGSKVQGEYSKWLNTTAGQIQLQKNRTQEAYAALGLALDGVRNATASAISWLAGGLTEFVGGIQLIGNDIGYFFARIPHEITALWGLLVVAVANGLTQLGSILPIVGDGMTKLADKMGASGARIVHESAQHLGALKAAHEEVANEIVGIATNGEVGQTAALKTGLSDRKSATTAANTERKEQEKDAQAALKKLREGEAKAALEAMTAYGRAMHELQDQINTAMLSEDAATRDEATRLWKAGVGRIVMEYAKLEPSVRGTTLKVRNELATIPPALDEGGEAAEDSVVRWEKLKAQIGETGAAIGKGAEEILRFGRDIGSTNPQLEALIGGIGRLAEGIGGMASGNLLQGMSSAVLGLQGILGSLFGNSPAEQARKALLRENSMRLYELKAQIGDLLTSQSTGGQIAKFKGLDLQQFTAGGDSKSGRMMRAGAFGTYLNSKGIGMSDFEKVLGDIGIDWGEWKKDGITSAMMQQFITGMANFEPGQFDQSFSGQQDFLQRYFGVAGIDDPAKQAEFAKGNLAGKNDFLANLIGGFDLSTAEGRSGLQEAFAQVFQQLNAGTFDEGLFQDLKGSEFVDFIQYFTGLMNQITTGGVGGFNGGVGTGTSTGASPSLAGVTFTAGNSIDLVSAFVDPVGRIDINIGKMVELLTGLRLINVTIGTINAGDPAGIRAATVTALDEALRIERDLAAVTRGG